MLQIEAEVTEWYTYELTGEEEEAVRQIIIENEGGKFDYMDDDKKIVAAYEILEQKEGTGFFGDDNTIQNECSIEKYSYSELNECRAEEWIKENIPEKD